MKTASIKKVSAAALAAVLGFSGVSRAATLYSDNNAPLTGTYAESDSAPNAATYSGGVVTFTPGANTPSAPGYSDFQPTSGLASTPTLASLSAAPEASGGTLVTVQFTMNTAIAGTSSQVGVNIEDGSGNVIGGLLSTYGIDALPDLIASDGNNGEVAVPYIATQNDGSNGTYTLTLDPTNNVYFASYGGETYEGLMYAGGIPGGATLGDISLAGVDVGGAGSATFSDLTVTTAVPEPASIAMIGVGGVMLLARRPKRQQA